MSWLTNAVDDALEASVVGSFTRLGPWARRKMFHWDQETLPSLAGRTVVLSGATSGLGTVCARALFELGATIEVIARNPEKAAALCEEIRSSRAADNVATIDYVVADTGDLKAMRAAAATLAARHPAIDTLIHNAGALDDTFQLSPDGIEQTLASHVIGPWLLTRLLLPQLQAAGRRTQTTQTSSTATEASTTAPARLLWVSSGGMYVEPLDVDHLQMTPATYDGTRAYARAKRAQVTLNEMLAPRLRADNIVTHAMHPGWADTPGVARSLPKFRRMMGPLLRSPAGGAQTLIWLAASSAVPTTTTGKFWLDRGIRAIHRNSSSRDSDTPAEREKLWQRVNELAGVEAWPTA